MKDWIEKRNSIERKRKKKFMYETKFINEKGNIFVNFIYVKL
jgi:hypothetical protein